MRAQWEALGQKVWAAPEPQECSALAELYSLAMRDGAQVLAGYRDLSPQEREDIVSDKFVTQWRAIVAAANRRAFFVTAITRAAISALRRKTTEHKNEADLSLAAVPTARTEVDIVSTLDLAARLRQLSPRDQQVLRAVAEGEDREIVARHFDTSRANVDQIVSRAARLGREE